MAGITLVAEATSMSNKALVVLFAAGLLAACGKPAPGPAPAAPPVSHPVPPQAAAEAPAPAADAANSALPEPPRPAAVEDPGEDWLIWARTDDGWATRWVRVRDGAFETVARRGAVILSDGARLFRVERDDRTVDVKTCECVLDGEKSPECKDAGRFTVPGLRAFDLAGGAPIPVKPASEETMYGGDFSAGLTLVGGVGARLFFESSGSGYSCGAHGYTEAVTGIHDLAGGEVDRGLFKTTGDALPAQLRAQAAAELFPGLKECEGDEATLAGATEAMTLQGVRVTVGEGGAPEVTWQFAADVAYACSADYAVHGDARSGLIAEGGALGLSGPLPPGVLKAMADLPAGSVVGWSKLDLDAEARAAALASFQAAPEPSWDEAPPTEAATEVAALIAEGRTLSVNKDWSAAIAKFSEAVGLDPGSAQALAGRGYAWLRTGTLDSAETDLTKAIALGGDAVFMAQVWYNLGQVAERQNDKAAARSAYQTSLSLRPHPTVEEALKRVAR
ncbi:MAG: tetratricopeptide repeat protein [Deltaproteobacteria bacterium]|nr:tetratricopeptide repeat protein [Deltaproteobacteria bacterium]MCB9789299.1 tetratricopeptide repeat protein [Deltaproteobacteria bacterium]